MASNGKRTRGKQRIPMKMIENHAARLATFAKRKDGIIKKASELGELCGAQLGVVIFSAAGKAFSYGCPSIESIIHRFRNPAAVNRLQPMPCNDPRRENGNGESNDTIDSLLAELEEVKGKVKSLKETISSMKERAPANVDRHGWWEKPDANFQLPELQHKAALIEALYNDMRNHPNCPVDVPPLVHVGFGPGNLQ
ncbi:hypothetical protein SAY87_021013 [Trapa incisa]|uniref:MADS-box domain-containing protein n=2 Tax=Trapa TaxID=22665 RepID=A0AAN7RHQ3_TRANT|nr:hypothetical protein SAY87_021013 [Trapa incisa]KAK4803390.1 hypothetical protein SAY86_003207 [Trapa natans]